MYVYIYIYCTYLYIYIYGIYIYSSKQSSTPGSIHAVLYIDIYTVQRYTYIYIQRTLYFITLYCQKISREGANYVAAITGHSTVYFLLSVAIAHWINHSQHNHRLNFSFFH